MIERYKSKWLYALNIVKLYLEKTQLFSCFFKYFININRNKIISFSKPCYIFQVIASYQLPACTFDVGARGPGYVKQSSSP